MNLTEQLPVRRPLFESVPLQTGLEWADDLNFRCEEKMDGVWHILTVPPSAPDRVPTAVLAGELMPPCTEGRLFYAFDCLAVGGQDIASAPLRERLQALDAIVPQMSVLPCGAAGVIIRRPATGSCGRDLLRAVLARGGEGIVIKSLDAPFGDTWIKCKRQETFDLLVTEKHVGGKSSIRVAEIAGGQSSNAEDRGWCACRREFDHVQVGDVVEVAAFGLTARGKLREPRFVRVRPDKTVR